MHHRGQRLGEAGENCVFVLGLHGNQVAQRLIKPVTVAEEEKEHQQHEQEVDEESGDVAGDSSELGDEGVGRRSCSPQAELHEVGLIPKIRWEKAHGELSEACLSCALHPGRRLAGIHLLLNHIVKGPSLADHDAAEAEPRQHDHDVNEQGHDPCGNGGATNAGENHPVERMEHQRQNRCPRGSAEKAGEDPVDLIQEQSEDDKEKGRKEMVPGHLDAFTVTAQRTSRRGRVSFSSAA